MYSRLHSVRADLKILTHSQHGFYKFGKELFVSIGTVTRISTVWFIFTCTLILVLPKLNCQAVPKLNFDVVNNTKQSTNDTRQIQNSGIKIKINQNGKNETNVNTSGSTYPVLPGSIVHLFPRYGYLSLSMRIVSRNGSDNEWLFLEPSKSILEPTTFKIQIQQLKPLKKPSSSLLFRSRFQIDACEDIHELLAAYFKQFNIEGSSEGESWKAFAGGWQLPSVLRYFGIQPEFLTKENRENISYVLVRLLYPHTSGVFVPYSNLSVMQNFQEQFDSYEPTAYTSSYNFFNTIGSHYINNYMTGNSIYQVFLFDNTLGPGFEFIKEQLAAAAQSIGTDDPGVKNNIHSTWDLDQIPKLVTSWATHISKVMILNANAEVTRLIQNALSLKSITPNTLNFNTTTMTGFPFSTPNYLYYSNIFKMYNNRKLSELVEKSLDSQHDGLIGLELKMIDFLFKHQDQKDAYLNSIESNLKLWEANL